MVNSTRAKRSPPSDNGHANPFKRRTSADAATDSADDAHIFGNKVRCATEARGHATPRGRSRFEIVVDASEGFIPLWSKGMTLRWRFHKRSLNAFENPEAAKKEIRKLMARALMAWDTAVPIKFAERDDLWDFEVVMRNADDCDNAGCVLASAFFPDHGRHDLLLYPELFEQSAPEQLSTLVHELGHVFGLRHFFANIEEKEWPSKTFGTHKPFTIMNYGRKSKLTAADKSDLKRLYQQVWLGELTEINKTPIKLVKPFHYAGN